LDLARHALIVRVEGSSRGAGVNGPAVGSAGGSSSENGQFEILVRVEELHQSVKLALSPSSSTAHLRGTSCGRKKREKK